MKIRSFHSTCLRLTAIFFVASMMTACSKRSAPTSEEPWLPQSGEVMRAEATAGGIVTSYVAYFDKEHLQRIGELRKAEAQLNDAAGDYTFTGARLTQYKGAALGGGSIIELTFDMQGALIASSGGVDEKEVAAIRTRAQLLRSLALARRASMQHSQ